MSVANEPPRPPARPNPKIRLPVQIARVALRPGAAVALGFCWGVIETLIIRSVFTYGAYFSRDIFYAINGRVIFYGAVAVVLWAFLTPAFKLWGRIIKKPLTLDAAAKRALVGAAVVAAYVNATILLLCIARVAAHFTEHDFLRLGLLTALPAAVAVVGTALILAGLRRRNQTFRRILPYVFCAVLVAGAAVGVASLTYRQYQLLTRPDPGTLPDVVVITLDAWRADAFNEELTPTIFAYARERGLIYTEARAPSSWTLPSFAAALSGSYNVTAPDGLKTANDKIPTWAQVMSDNGFETYAVLSNPNLDMARFHFRGFTHFSYVNYKPALSRLRFYDTAVYFALRGQTYRVETPGDTTRRLTAAACETLRRPSRRPKFVWVHILDPHFPYQPLPQVLEQNAPYLHDKTDVGLYQKHFVEDNSAVLKRLYEEEVRSTDALIAPLIAELKGEENVLVIISSDHGEEFFEHGGKEHGRTLYDEVCKVPLVIALPHGGARDPRTGIVTEPVSLVDVAPSVLNYLDLPVPPTMEGRRDLWTRNTSESRTTYFSLSRKDYILRASLQKGKKIILRAQDGITTTEYFDLKADPNEKTALPLDGEGARLREGLLKWAREKRVTSDDGAGAASLFGDREDLKALGYL